MSRERHDTCFNCGNQTRIKVLVWSPGSGTFWRCQDQRKCKAELGPCAHEGCGRLPDNHPNSLMDHGFTRNAKAQATVDRMYPSVH